MGKEPDSSQNINRLIKMASDVIDQLTAYRIAKGEIVLSEAPQFIQDQVKKATAAMTEYYINNGGYDATTQDEVDSLNIGSFSYSMTKSNGAGKSFDVPSKVIDLLSHTGLLYAGIQTVGGGVSYDC